MGAMGVLPLSPAAAMPPPPATPPVFKARGLAQVDLTALPAAEAAPGLGAPVNGSQACTCSPGQEPSAELPALRNGTAIATDESVPKTPTEDKSWAFDQVNQTLLGCILFEFAIVLGLYAVHVWWTRKQKLRARRAGVVKQSEAYAQSIVKHFLPSIQVEKHRFRGLRPKHMTISLAFEDLGLRLHSGMTVLDGVTGSFASGRMCAIMGPSGAGKTTFMNVLCGKATYGDMTGTVLINGEKGDIRDFKSVMGFVPQDDIVHQNLTVSEQICFSANLRGAHGISRRRCDFITNDVLSVMQIDHIRNSVVGSVESRGISGGQRKRVNIGLELAADPTVLFLDEPTSGLDSTSSLTIVHSLKRLTTLGMTAIMVIHQPRYSLFTLFDDVLLLGKGGRTVYLGPSLGAKSYFESIGFTMPADENPADWFMDVISGEVGNKKIPRFQPTTLFELWADHSRKPREWTDERRIWTQADDRAALYNALLEEWKMIDLNASNSLDQEELRQLLIRCEGREPDEEVVEELFDSMKDDSQKYVGKEDFLNFLTAIQDTVYEDARLSVEDSDSDSSDSGTEAFFASTLGTLRDLGRGNAHLQRGRPQHFRKAAGFKTQTSIILKRRLIQWWRNNDERILFLGVIALAANILGVMDKFICKEPYWAAAPYLNLHTALALLTSVYCLRTFGSDRPMFWRESSCGLNVFAFFLARVFINIVDLILQCFLFSAIYFFIRRPALNFGWYITPFLLVSFASSGVGYFISAILPPVHGPFVAALVSFVSCGLLGHPLRVSQMEDGSYLEYSMDVLSITRWSVPMNFLESIDQQPPHDVGFRQGELDAMETTYRTNPIWQERGYWQSGIFFLLSMGTLLHIGTYLGLRFTNRNKQI